MENEMETPPSSPEVDENTSLDENTSFNRLEYNRLIFEAINTIISDAAANAAEEQALAAAIDESLQTQAAYKETISEEGIKQLKQTTYSKENHPNDKCSITLEDLNEWDGPVTQLPCTHVFLPDAIYQWLKENPVCPICRYKMDSKEIKVQAEQTQAEQTQAEQTQAEQQSQEVAENGPPSPSMEAQHMEAQHMEAQHMEAQQITSQTIENYPTSSTILNTLLYLNQHSDQDIYRSRNTFLRNINNLQQ